MHPSEWNPDHGGDIRKPGVVPTWTFCRICELVEQAEKAGPPPGKDAKGWRLTFMRPTWEEATNG